jgi:hypothetical protein
VDAAVLDPVRLVGVGAEAALAVLLRVAVVALEPLDVAVAFEGEDVGGDAVEESAVVGDHDHAAREALEGVLEGAQGDLALAQLLSAAAALRPAYPEQAWRQIDRHSGKRPRLHSRDEQSLPPGRGKEAGCGTELHEILLIFLTSIPKRSSWGPAPGREALIVSALDTLRKHLRPGAVYRRHDLSAFSTNLDRHLKELVDEGSLRKLRRGLYSCPQTSSFGEAPPGETELLGTFLKSDKFLAYSPNTFNSLGLGTTQLYNVRTVLNQKRHGSFVLDGRSYFFHRRLNVPEKLTKEVLVVELLNNLKKLAEDPNELLDKLRSKLPSFDRERLLAAARRYGTCSTQKKMNELAGTAHA